MLLPTHPSSALLYLLPPLWRWYGVWQNLRRLQWAHPRECDTNEFLESTVWGQRICALHLDQSGKDRKVTGSAPAWFKLKSTVDLTADTRVNSSFKPSSTRSLGLLSQAKLTSFNSLSVALAWCMAELALQRQHRGECVKVSQGGGALQSPVTPYLLETLYWAVVSFPVWGSCTVARLNYSSFPSRRTRKVQNKTRKKGRKEKHKRETSGKAREENRGRKEKQNQSLGVNVFGQKRTHLSPAW